ncbi:amidohydrolase [Xylariaceae sp. FL0804]|nr:amidohydrolase [Xylariaceae sp. FL0804]
MNAAPSKYGRGAPVAAMKLLRNVAQPLHRDGLRRCDIEVDDDGTIRRMTPSEPPAPDHHGEQQPPPSALLLPPLCHPHIHLDKAYLLTSNHPAAGRDAGRPDYADLAPRSGSFAEALANTARAKERYTAPDLYLRGAQLLAASYAQGVTAVRAFVELDHVTGTLPLTAAARLQRDFAHLVDVRICAFAQDPLFSGAHGDANRTVLADALRSSEGRAVVDALGSTPYVETTRAAALRNVEWAVATARELGLHLDFHLDYNLDEVSDGAEESQGESEGQPLAFAVIETLKRHGWPRADADGKTGTKTKTVVLGHCTRLSMLPDAWLRRLAASVLDSGLPVHFVGLPTSDLFMMGRPSANHSHPHSRPRGTLQVPALIRDLGLAACAGVNNVGNAFTPFGDGDPLQLACWGVGLYQAGTVADAELLYGCVASRARTAIGLQEEEEEADDKDGEENTERKTDTEGGDASERRLPREMLLIENARVMRLPGAGAGLGLEISARPRIGIKDVIWDPPPIALRSIVRRPRTI